MPKKKIEVLQDLFKLAGGSTPLAAKLGLHAFTVENWRRNGVPVRYWDAIIESYGVTTTELHEVGKVCRVHTYGEGTK